MTSMKNKRLGIISIILLTIIICVALGGYLFKSRPIPKIQITSVGDSLTQGVGDNNQGGYPSLIKTKINKTKLAVAKSSNYGIAGETTPQINKRVVEDHQVKQGIKKADVITITTGGNDLIAFFKANALETNTKQLTKKLGVASQNYQDNLQLLLSNIRKLNPKANIYLFGIYNPLYVYFPQVKLIGQTVSEWNKTAQYVAKQSKRVYFVAIDRQLSNGQFQTDKQKKQLTNNSNKVNASATLDAASISSVFSGSGSEINKYLSNDDHFHPNHKGYQVMTNDLYKSMTNHESWLKEK